MKNCEALGKALRSVTDDEVAFIVIVKPCQKKENLTISDDGRVVLRIKAPAVEGRANEGVVEFLAKILDLSKREVIVARGHLSRHKEIRMKNTNRDVVMKSLLAFVNAQGENAS